MFAELTMAEPWLAVKVPALEKIVEE